MRPKRWRTNCSRKPERRRPPMTPSSRTSPYPRPEALNLFPGRTLLLFPTHLLLPNPLLPFRPIIRKPNPTGNPTWRDVDPSVWALPANLFQQVQEGLEEVQSQYKRLVKYSRTMKDLLAEIQKVVLPGHTPRRVLYQGAPRSPTGTLHEVVGEVPLVQNPPTVSRSSQQEGGTRPSNSGRDPSIT